jgi:hypothetical protein
MREWRLKPWKDNGNQRGNQNWCKGASVAVLQILLGMDGSRGRFDYALSKWLALIIFAKKNWFFSNGLYFDCNWILTHYDLICFDIKWIFFKGHLIATDN